MPRTSYEPPIYRFRVRILGGFYAPLNATDIWREIEIASNQTLEDLGDMIPWAFEFTDSHLWSFFLSGRAWDQSTEYALDTQTEGFGPAPRAARRVKIRDIPYPGKTGRKEFLYIFDYGDEWHFGVKLLGVIDTPEAGATYPRIVTEHGEAPPQYPDSEDEEEWDEDDDEDEDEDEDLDAEEVEE